MDQAVSFLNDWQTLIGAFLGFLSATLIAQRMWVKREERRLAHESKSLASALLSEIGALMTLCEARENDLKQLLEKTGSETFQAGNPSSLLIKGTLIYETNAHHIGILPDKIVLAVVIFYNRIFNYNTMIKDGHVGTNRHKDMVCAKEEAIEALGRLDEFCSFKL